LLDGLQADANGELARYFLHFDVAELQVFERVERILPCLSFR